MFVLSHFKVIINCNVTFLTLERDGCRTLADSACNIKISSLFLMSDH